MKTLKTVFAGSVLSVLFTVVPAVALAQTYPYAYTYYPTPVPQQLSCVASASTVHAGEAVTFTASGGWGEVYNWATPERTYLNVGRQITVALFVPGVHSVVVSAGPQTAACSITVTNVGGTTGPVVQHPTYPVTYFASQYVPNLPNTGFAPLTALSFAFATVLLIAGGLFISPYVKRTLASTFR